MIDWWLDKLDLPWIMGKSKTKKGKQKRKEITKKTTLVTEGRNVLIILFYKKRK